MNSDAVQKVMAKLLETEGEQIVRDMAGHVGDQLHDVLKRNGMMLRTTGGAIGMGVLAAIEVLADTVEFARQSGDTPEEADLLGNAALCLFASEMVNLGLAEHNGLEGVAA